MTETTTAYPALEVDDLDAAAVLAVLGEAETRIRAAERDKLVLVGRWCVLHPARTSTGAPAAHATWSDAGERDVLDCDEALGGEGAPLVAAFAAEELAGVLGVSPRTGMQLVADVLNLVHRHPRVWARVLSLEVPGWRARRLAQRTASLAYESARWVDEQLAGRIDSCGPVSIDRAVAEAKARFEPEDQAAAEEQAKAAWDVRLFPTTPGDWAGTSAMDAVGDTLDLTRFHDLVCATAHELAQAGDTDTLGQRKAKALGVIADRLTTTTSPGTGRAGRAGGGGKPRFYLHLDASMLAEPTGIGAAEQLGALTMDRLRAWLGGATVVVRPVLDLNRTDAVDAHDPPAWMDDQVRLRDRHCVFPWCDIDSRHCDLDHIVPYDPGTPEDPGPPGQTRPENLAPLCRRHHRAKTSRRWRYHRHRDGTYTWTSPAGRTYLVTPSGTTQAH
jgi:hypothetical protein